MRKYLAEFIGTFALVFCGTGAIIIDQQTNGSVGHIGVAITFGLIILSMIYAFGEISGAHFIPAVTLCFASVKRFPGKEILPYVVSQILGGILASFILKFLFPENLTLGVTLPAGSPLQSFILEFILTYFLVIVIMNVSQGSKETGVMAGIAIGSVVLLEAMFAGPITGASMNPARSIAPALISGNIQSLWIYLMAPVMGALVAGHTWKYMSKNTSSKIN